MSSREQILSRVRSALGRETSPAPPAPPPARIRIPEVPIEARVEAFCTALEKLNGRTLRAHSGAEAAGYARQLLGGGTAVASNAAFLAECGITQIEGVRSGLRDQDELRQLCAAADLGITSADFALADTGTLVMISSLEEARLISLLPPVHLAVVPRQRLLSGLDELFSLLPHPAERSSSMVLITGPSRTADIEQILVRGVHGPGEVHVVLV